MRLPPLCVGGFPALALTSPLFGGGFALGGEAGLEAGGWGGGGAGEKRWEKGCVLEEIMINKKYKG